MKAKKFLAQMGSQNTIKVFDAETGHLLRVINCDGTITSAPYCIDNTLCVSINKCNTTSIVMYTLPSGSIKSIQPN